jgi:cell division protein FtsB
MAGQSAAMVIRRRLRSILVPVVLYAVSAGVVGYFMHNAKTGNRGLNAKQMLKVEIHELMQSLDASKAEHQDWDRRLALMRADQVDRDLLEERARIILGRVHKNDLVIVAP